MDNNFKHCFASDGSNVGGAICEAIQKVKTQHTYAIWESRGGKSRFHLTEHRDTTPYSYTYNEYEGSRCWSSGNMGACGLEVALERTNQLLSYYPVKMKRLGE